jgi:hypothetical protein
MAGNGGFEVSFYNDETGQWEVTPDPSSKPLAVRKKKAAQAKEPSAGDYLATLGDVLVVNPRNSAAATLGGAAYDYAVKSTPQSVKNDVVRAGQDAYKWLRKENKALRDAPITESLRLLKAGYIDPLADPYRVFKQAATERARGNEVGGKKLAAMVPLAVAGVLPQGRGAGKLAAKAGAEAAETATKKATKKATKGAEKKVVKSVKVPASPKTDFERPSVSPIATQAGERGLPLRGQAQTQAQHPSKFGVFSSYKTPTPVEETVVVAEPYAVLPRDRMFDTSRLENAKIVSLYGDRERAGDTILRVNDHPTNVDTQGGAMFPALQEALESEGAWASEFGALGPVRRAVAEGLDAGQRVFGVTTAMGPGALNQTIDMTDLLHQMATTSPIRKSDLSVFNKQARDILPGYAGLLHDEAAQQLHGMTQGQRKAFVALVDNANALKQGFPNVPAARYALTDPNLVDVPAGTSGYSFVEFGPESLKSLEGGVGHRSYPDRMSGTFEGRGPLVPFTTMFSDFAKSRRDANALPGSDLRAFELGKPSQNMTPEAYDLLMKYLQGIEDPY